MAKFPSLKARKLLALLMRRPLNYRIISTMGSHRKLVSASGYPDIGFSFHERVTVSASRVRDILVNDIGLTEQEALNLL
jgi:hypothetical protein